MSESDVEIVRQSWEAWSVGDLTRVFEVFAPEIVWDVTHFDWPEQSLYRGRQEVERFFQEWLASWDTYEAGVEELIDVGDRVVTLAWQRARVEGSTVPVEMLWAQIATVREGRIVLVENYSDRDEALEAAGANR